MLFQNLKAQNYRPSKLGAPNNENIPQGEKSEKNISSAIS